MSRAQPRKLGVMAVKLGGGVEFAAGDGTGIDSIHLESR